MTASGLPAARTRLLISLLASWELCCDGAREDIAEMAESIDEVRGGPFMESTLVDDALAILGRLAAVEPTGFVLGAILG
jgi:hypothetical protein